MNSKLLALALAGASAVAGHAALTYPSPGPTCPVKPTYTVVACWKDCAGRSVSCPIGCVNFLDVSYYGCAAPTRGGGTNGGSAGCTWPDSNLSPDVRLGTTTGTNTVTLVRGAPGQVPG